MASAAALARKQQNHMEDVVARLERLERFVQAIAAHHGVTVVEAAAAVAEAVLDQVEAPVAEAPATEAPVVEEPVAKGRAKKGS